MTNLHPFKDRQVDINKPVSIYRNLNKQGVWYSIKQGGMVVAHSQHISVRDVCFNVNENGRQRVIKERRKNVHATIKGFIVENEINPPVNVSIRYNPYIFANFFYTNNDQKQVTVKEAELIVLDNLGMRGIV